MLSPAERSRRCPARAGFTLVELLVAMVISLLLGGVILQVIQGQARFVDVQGARQEVQQNARGTVELIASELRSVPPGGIVDASQNRIEFLLPRAWGVLCSDVSALITGVTWVLFPQGAFPADFPSNTDLLSENNWGIALPATADETTWAPAAVELVTTGTIPAGTCEFDQTVLANQDAREITWTAETFPMGAVAGARVFLYQRIIYEAGTDGTSEMIWAKRNNGASATQVMAGPLGPPTGNPATDGLIFRYDCVNGRMSTPPGANTNGWPDLTAVQVEVAMQSQEANADSRQVERDSIQVYLRNSTGGADCVL